jgi:hypothetical protein
MTVFDPSTSQPTHSEVEMLRSVLGPTKPLITSLQVASRGYRRRQRTGRIRRALIVAGLAASFCGSAFLLSANRPSPGAVAARNTPAALDAETTGSIGTYARRLPTSEYR